MRTRTIYGKFVNLRIAEIDDAEFTLKVRQNGEKNKYIPSLSISIEQQREWIRHQIISEDCYFFVVERKNKEKIGTFSLYDIDEDHAEAGRLVMLGNPIESLETGLLFNLFAFEIAKMKLVVSEIDEENMAAIGYSNRLGGKEIRKCIDSKTGRNMIIYHSTPEGFYGVLPSLLTILHRFSGERG